MQSKPYKLLPSPSVVGEPFSLLSAPYSQLLHLVFTTNTMHSPHLVPANLARLSSPSSLSFLSLDLSLDHMLDLPSR